MQQRQIMKLVHFKHLGLMHLPITFARPDLNNQRGLKILFGRLQKYVGAGDEHIAVTDNEARAPQGKPRTIGVLVGTHNDHRRLDFDDRVLNVSSQRASR